MEKTNFALSPGEKHICFIFPRALSASFLFSHCNLYIHGELTFTHHSGATS
uniref:Uncharacterized protein n=1 Tax=Triticum urartu TaxID=4572 RepID=A0A8R7VD81_TRIUA